MLTTLTELAAATGGTVRGPDVSFVRVCADSREVDGSTLFVAIPGERVDGHDYVETARPAATLASRPVPGPHVLVPDTVSALGALAAWHRGRLTAHVVGVTGSAGKTSTKDLLAAVLAESGPVIAPPGSYNTDVGAPLTVLRAGADTAHLVVEMGARHAGDIARLVALARPHTGVVLNVGSAHLGEFGSREAIAAAKGELAEGASELAVLNADDDLVAAMADRAPAAVRFFGSRGEVRAEGLTLDDHGRPAFRLVAPEGSTPVRMLLVGAHQASNALAAAAVGLSAGLSVEVVGAALNRAMPASRWRMEVGETPTGVRVVNDAYNANPESMRAALGALAAIAVSGRRWAVLGPMYELGEDGEAAHASVGAYARSIARTVAVGAPAYAADVDVADVAAAVAVLSAELRPGDVVLVKASRGAALERVARALLEDAPVTGTPQL